MTTIRHDVIPITPGIFCISEFKLVNAFLVLGHDKAALTAAILDHHLPDLTAAGRRVAEARSLPRLGAQLCEVYRTLGAPSARPHPAAAG